MSKVFTIYTHRRFIGPLNTMMKFTASPAGFCVKFSRADRRKIINYNEIISLLEWLKNEPEKTFIGDYRVLDSNPCFWERGGFATEERRFLKSCQVFANIFIKKAGDKDIMVEALEWVLKRYDSETDTVNSPDETFSSTDDCIYAPVVVDKGYMANRVVNGRPVEMKGVVGPEEGYVCLRITEHDDPIAFLKLQSRKSETTFRIDGTSFDDMKNKTLDLLTMLLSFTSKTLLLEKGETYTSGLVTTPGMPELKDKLFYGYGVRKTEGHGVLAINNEDGTPNNKVTYMYKVLDSLGKALAHIYTELDRKEA